MAKVFPSFFVNKILSTNKSLYKQITKIVGLCPKNEELYKLAFIHKSASLRLPNGNVVNNERLEFLGDAVLDAVVAEYLYLKFPNENEGFLTQTRSKIVNGDYLGQLAISLELDKLIVSHVCNFNTNKHILGDAFEAFIGALYLDRGYRAVKKFITKQLIYKHIDISEVLKTENNYKSRLIEWAQKEKKEIEFETNEIPQNTNNQEFISSVVVVGEIISKGEGLSKKEAEQQAAMYALEKLNKKKINKK